MKIRLYTTELELLAFDVPFKSVLWSEGYNTVEPFCLEVQATPEMMKKVKPEIYAGRDDRKTLMVIKTVKAENGVIIATGKQAARCLDDVPFVGTIPKGSQVAEAAQSALKAGGGYSGFAFAKTAPEVTYDHQISNKSVLELMLTMYQKTDTGFRAVKSGKTVEIQTYRPAENQNLKFSEALGNLTVGSLILSTENAKNHAIVLGAGESDERSKVEIDQSDGGQKLSMIIDARDIQKRENEAESEYLERLEARGIEKLRERKRTWECAFTPLAADFGKRYDLGDILTVILAEYGLKLKARVVRFTQKEQENQIETKIEVGEITIVR
jgi:hypothetical protein